MSRVLPGPCSLVMNFLSCRDANDEHVRQQSRWASENRDGAPRSMEIFRNGCFAFRSIIVGRRRI